MEKERVEWIDSLKGFAMICVVLGHIADGYMNAGMFPENKQFLHNLFNGCYMFHMALFFALSGMSFQMAYGSSLSGGGAEQRRIRRQIINLTLLYVLYCILNWVFKVMLPEYVNHKANTLDIILIWGKPIYPYWYFYVLIIFYLVFYKGSICRILRMNQIAVIVVLFIVSAISGFVNVNGWFELNHILHDAFFFYLGIMYTERQTRRFFKPVIIGILFLPIVNTIVATGIVVGIIYLFSHIEIANRKGLYNYLGKHSLEIYVIHCFLTAGNRVLFAKLGIANVYVSIILNMTLSISGSLFFSYITRKLQVYNLFFRPYRLFEKEGRQW